MAWLRDNIEAARFKPAPGGYIFQMSGPWLFGPANPYFVTEAQKFEILAIIIKISRWGLGLSLLWILFCGLTSAVVAWALSGAVLDLAIAMLKVLPIASVVLFPFVVVRLTFHQLRPMLAGLPHADDQGSQITP
jgi:hypothetical protein